MAESATTNATKGSDLEPDQSTSAFRLYALGTVAADFEMKGLDEDPDQTLEVFVDELFSGADGKLVAKGQTSEVKGTDSQGREYQAKAATTTSTAAFWLPFGTNRMTAPSMVKGMRVLLWRTADEEQLYWQPKGGDDQLMTCERVVYTFQANQDRKKNNKKVDVQNCWYFEIDTFRSRFMFGTSQMNGEVTRLFIEGDLSEGNGFLRIADDVHQNLFLLHFVEHMLRYQNQEGTIFDINKEKIHMQCEDSITAISKNSISMKTKEFALNCKNATIEAENTVSVTCQQAIWKMQTWLAQVSGSATWKCPMVVFTGSVQFTGEDGNTVELNGNFRHKAGIWTAPSGTNVYTHDHSGVQRGLGKTDPFM